MLKADRKSTRRKSSIIDDRIFDRQAVICKAFAHPKRLKLLTLLSEGERRMSELQKELALSRANMSQHVAILRGAGVVEPIATVSTCIVFWLFPR